MLIPRFSIRWLLAMTSVCALFSYVVAQAVAGAQWALAMTASLSLVATCFLLYAVAFLIAYGLARFTRSLRSNDAPQTPFASDEQLPPQIIPKRIYPE